MKQMLYKHRGELVLYVLFLTIALLVTLIRVDYNFTAPGYNAEVSDFIVIEDAYNQEGSFHTTSVIVVRRMTLLQKFIADKEDTVYTSEIPQYYEYIDDLDDITVMGYQMKDDSIANALVVGISNANLEIDYTLNNVVYLIYNYMTENTLEIGDVVLDVNGNDPYSEIQSTACEEDAIFNIMRDDETLQFTLTKTEYKDDTCGFGVYISELTEINSSDVNYTIQTDNTSGPSGGLMQALYVFNLLTPNDITGGVKVAGTGTIDADGKVGPIGGIEQKIITSAQNGIDIFFVPHLSDSITDNYIRAKAILETLDTDMKLIPVSTFSDARNYLESKFGGAFDE